MRLPDYCNALRFSRNGLKPDVRTFCEVVQGFCYNLCMFKYNFIVWHKINIHWLYICLHVCMSVCKCMCLCEPTSLCFCLCLYLCVCHSVSLSLCLCLSLCVSLCLSVSVSRSVCLSLSLSLFIKYRIPPNRDISKAPRHQLHYEHHYWVINGNK